VVVVERLVLAVLDLVDEVLVDDLVVRAVVAFLAVVAVVVAFLAVVVVAFAVVVVFLTVVVVFLAVVVVGLPQWQPGLYA